jgi:protein involved in polysaccharide export with SLBB domain
MLSICVAQSRFNRAVLRLAFVLMLPISMVLTNGIGRSYAEQSGAAAPDENLQYRLGAGDKLRITVFGEPDLSGEFEIDGAQMISLPLIGQIPAGGSTTPELERTILERLRQGYLKNPRITIEVLNYRPFFILGEVNKPGSYPYVNGITVLNAIALSGGYSYRASKDRTLITRGDDSRHEEQPASETTVIRPGDTIRVRERFF